MSRREIGNFGRRRGKSKSFFFPAFCSTCCWPPLMALYFFLRHGVLPLSVHMHVCACIGITVVVGNGTSQCVFSAAVATHTMHQQMFFNHFLHDYGSNTSCWAWDNLTNNWFGRHSLLLKMFFFFFLHGATNRNDNRPYFFQNCSQLFQTFPSHLSTMPNDYHFCMRFLTGQPDLSGPDRSGQKIFDRTKPVRSKEIGR